MTANAGHREMSTLENEARRRVILDLEVGGLEAVDIVTRFARLRCFAQMGIGMAVGALVVGYGTKTRSPEGCVCGT